MGWPGPDRRRRNHNARHNTYIEALQPTVVCLLVSVSLVLLASPGTLRTYGHYYCVVALLAALSFVSVCLV